MKITLKNHAGLCEKLPLKNQTVQVASFFSYLEIEPGQDIITDVSINEQSFEFEPGQNVQIPCYMGIENMTMVQLISNHKPIRIALKYDSALFAGESLIETFADFHRHVTDWSQGRGRTIAELVGSIQTGEISLLQMINPLTGLDDQSLLEDIYKVLPFALDICEKPRQHLRIEEEVLDVELVKRISPSSLQHLASHSEHWRSRTITGLIPSRLKAEVYEDEINIYENIFFRMVMQALLAYVTVKGDQVRAAIAQKDTLHDWEYYANEVNDYKKMEMLRKLVPELDSDTEEQLRKAFRDFEKKLNMIEKQLSTVISTPFYQRLDPVKSVELPIQPTNIINMDNRYNELFKIWNRLMLTTKKSAKQEELSGAVVTNVELYYQTYTTIMLIYSLHLMGYNFEDGSSVMMQGDGHLSTSFTVRTNQFTIRGTETMKDGRAVFAVEFEENLAVECQVPVQYPGDFSALSDDGIFEEHFTNGRKLVFKKRPTLELERQLSQTIRKYMDDDRSLSNEQKRKLAQVDKEWRQQFTDLMNRLPTPKRFTLYLYSVFGQIGKSESEVLRNTTTLLQSLSKNGDESHLLVMPLDLEQFDKLLNRKLIKRLVNYGESYDEEDAPLYGTYQGLFPVSKTDLRSVQRFSKLFFMTVNQQLIKWSPSFTHCPACQSTNIAQEDAHSWLCREFDCQLIWGKTRCTNGCQNYYEWMRPNFDLSLSVMEKDSPLQELQLKEKIFDSLVLTDFESSLNNQKLVYIPVCPRCGTSNT